MKKIIALVLSLMMVLCAFSALAEETTVEKTDMGVLDVNGTFKIQSKLPEGYSYEPVEVSDLSMFGLLTAGEDKPVIMMSIAYNEQYADVERFNDLPEEAVELIRESFKEEDEEATFEDLETAYGTRLLKVTDPDFVDIYTVYKGYEMEFYIFTVTEEGITDADVKMLVDFISDMDFVALVEETVAAE